MASPRPTSISLPDTLDPNGILLSKFVKVREFVDTLLSRQLPNGMQAVLTDEAFYTDHGLNHIRSVVSRLGVLNALLPQHLVERECFLLLVAAYCHDVGMLLGRHAGESQSETRAFHHERSAELVREFAEKGHIELDNFELPVVEAIVKAHRIVDLDQIREEHRILGVPIRTRLLAALLRVADACDIDHSRAPESVFNFFEDIIPPLSRDHWARHQIVSDVEFNTERASIVLSADLGRQFTERIEKARMANTIRKQLEREREAVSDTLSQYGIYLHRVEVKDYEEDHYVQLSEPSVTENYVLVGLTSSVTSIQPLHDATEPYLAGGAGPALIVEIEPPEGPLFISTKWRIEPLRLADLEDAIKNSMTTDVVYFTGSSRAETVIPH